jgi:uncharacterized protein YprB with RNaseH-like and TPR domain
MSVSDRLREILRTSRLPGDALPAPKAPPEPRALESLEQILGGRWRQHANALSFVVERRTPSDVKHGCMFVGDIADGLAQSALHARLLTPAHPARTPFMFFDLETSGLNGGAGTCAFLVGCAWCTEDGAFLTRQYLLTCSGDEKAMLDIVAGELSRAGALVTFNGKSFDAPLLEMRYLFHRLEWAGANLPHLDILHPARLFWGDPEVRLKADPTYDSSSVRLQPDRDPERSCSLTTLERDLLGATREGDVPGFEIPARYFQFLRTGNARPLKAVLEHNRLDLLTLAALTARMLELVGEGPGKAANAREALALGRVYQRAGLEVRAREAFEHALMLSASMPARTAAPIRIDALRSLALTARRQRRYDDAASWWRQVLSVTGCPRSVEREALEALAIHHEHRLRDLEAARTFALENLVTAGRPSAVESARHRVARLERKLAVRTKGGLESPPLLEQA